MVLYRGFIFFPIFIHVLVSLVHFIHVLVLLVHELLLLIYGYCYRGYDRNVPYILLWYYPYVMGIIPLCHNP